MAVTTKKPAVVRVDAVVRALRKEIRRVRRRDWIAALGATGNLERDRLAQGLGDAIVIVERVAERLARPAQRKGKR